MRPIRVRLDADRWHFQHGPIDLVIGADGDVGAVAAAHEAAWRRFQQVLDELVAELPLLRCAVDEAAVADASAGAGADAEAEARAGESAPAGVGITTPCPLRSSVAQRMWHACQPFAAAAFISPMAAVAGAVADDLIAAYRQGGVRRAWVNNGGDIALHLAAGESLRVGLLFGAGDSGRPLRLATGRAVAARPAVGGDRLATDGRFDVCAGMPVRGVATSGWRGRSFSLGIADSVTVLARTAAEADAAATVIANAVDVDDPRIVRRPACELKDDSDLGMIPVTVAVPPLGAAAVWAALQAGLRRARALQARGLIAHAVLACQGAVVATQDGDAVGASRAKVTSPSGTAAPVCATNRRAARPLPERTTRETEDRLPCVPQNPAAGSVFA